MELKKLEFPSEAYLKDLIEKTGWYCSTMWYSNPEKGRKAAL